MRCVRILIGAKDELHKNGSWLNAKVETIAVVCGYVGLDWKQDKFFHKGDFQLKRENG